ncbi:hypothetical protein K0B96_09395 [Horticoccus luteus]|uniref:DNA repair protein RecO n=1 Tax=Horticoccus luteus TaxID=2862869 RepID=A0A8F9XF06_9BACT|nr:hypothetical protein [Horticoccus luteus]QYM77542.1 hypothetical protein K0B96_09395 [Horticoccus luteus]
MPGASLQTDAFVLGKRPPSDAFQTLTCFSAEHGPLLVLQRLPKKSAGTSTLLDLFDEAALVLEASNQGQLWFVKEVRLLARPAGIGQSYATLEVASRFAQLIARNHVAPESRADVYRLVHQAFAAFASAARADIALFKSLYRFARDQGYPLKEQWFPSLTAPDQTQVTTLLNRPLAGQSAAPADVARLQTSLEDYLRRETEILLD